MNLRSLILTLIFLSGCASYRLEGPTRLVDHQEIAITKLFAKSDVKLVDERGFWQSGHLRTEFFLSPGGEIVKENEPNFDLTILMPECEVVKGFWQTPYNLFMVPLLNVGRVYDCKLTVAIIDKKSGETTNFETKATDYTFVGLFSILAGYMSAESSTRNRKEKALIFEALKGYLEENGFLKKPIKDLP